MRILRAGMSGDGEAILLASKMVREKALPGGLQLEMAREVLDQLESMDNKAIASLASQLKGMIGEKEQETQLEELKPEAYAALTGEEKLAQTPGVMSDAPAATMPGTPDQAPSAQPAFTNTPGQQATDQQAGMSSRVATLAQQVSQLSPEEKQQLMALLSK